MNIDIQHYKTLLEEELNKLTGELESIGTKNESTGTVWNSIQKNDQDTADREEVAENIETFDNQENVISILEAQKSAVVAALDKIEKGTYGLCEVDGKEIEKERLDANASAKTCLACMNK